MNDIVFVLLYIFAIYFLFWCWASYRASCDYGEICIVIFEPLTEIGILIFLETMVRDLWRRMPLFYQTNIQLE
jgi:hypothetical protein